MTREEDTAADEECEYDIDEAREAEQASKLPFPIRPLYDALKHELDQEVDRPDADFTYILVLDHHCQQYLNDPLHHTRLLNDSSSISIDTRHALVMAFRRYMQWMTAEGWHIDDVQAVSTVAALLISQPIAHICQTHPALFHGAEHVTSDEAEAAMYERRDAEASIGEIVKAQQFVRDGRTFASLREFVSELERAELPEQWRRNDQRTRNTQ